ncbi:MAG: YhcH/YjgK/YiaL family protein [Muribaculaceae bacterium]|nr:YhcH/YjgK/YiaL family protein [Muribaculaceae bacterium]
MILSTISDLAAYRGISTNLDAAIDWLITHADAEFVKGVTTFTAPTGAEITVKCEEPALLPREKVQLEAHQRFIDIHVPLKGTEVIGWAPVSGMQYVRTAYDEKLDIEFYGDAAHSLLHVKRGQAAVMFPHDAHAPNIGLGTHRKLCIKVPV